MLDLISLKANILSKSQCVQYVLEDSTLYVAHVIIKYTDTFSGQFIWEYEVPLSPKTIELKALYDKISNSDLDIGLIFNVFLNDINCDKMKDLICENGTKYRYALFKTDETMANLITSPVKYTLLII